MGFVWRSASVTLCRAVRRTGGRGRGWPEPEISRARQYTINQYTLTFIVDDQPYKTSTLDFGAAITIPDAPVKEGYEFLGWGEVAKTMPAHDLEYKAEFKQSALLGDVNLDGQINAADVVAVYNFITLGEASGVALERADVNNDAQVNAGDVVAIYVIITGGN